MIEIFILVSLTRKIAEIAQRKGLKPGRWKLYTILAWFGSEIAGFILGVTLIPDSYAFYLIGIGSAVGSYFVIRNKLNNMPDVTADDWINHIGESDNNDTPLPIQ